MPGELRTAFDFYQRKNERLQIAGLCAIVRNWNNLCLKEGKLNYDTHTQFINARRLSQKGNYH